MDKEFASTKIEEERGAVVCEECKELREVEETQPCRRCSMLVCDWCWTTHWRKHEKAHGEKEGM